MQDSRCGRRSLYRVLQTQRCVWAEMAAGKLRLAGRILFTEKPRKLHGICERERARRPVEKAREQRCPVKARRAKRH